MDGRGDRGTKRLALLALGLAALAGCGSSALPKDASGDIRLDVDAGADWASPKDAYDAGMVIDRPGSGDSGTGGDAGAPNDTSTGLDMTAGRDTSGGETSAGGDANAGSDTNTDGDANTGGDASSGGDGNATSDRSAGGDANADAAPVDTKPHPIMEFSLPPQVLGPNGITAGPDGNIWFTYTQGIGRITLPGVATSFPVTGGAAEITAGPDGNLWFTSSPA